jgi:hypothetical protein
MQRIVVRDLGYALKIWTMSKQGKMRRETPTKGDMGCVWPRQESRSPTVTIKTKVGNNRCLYKKNKWGKMYKIQKRVPQCKMNAPGEAEMS